MNFQQLTLFDNHELDQRKSFLLLPRYKTAFLNNSYWPSAISNFLVKKQNWTVSLHDIEKTFCIPETLLKQGYCIVTPTAPPDLVLDRPNIASRKKHVEYTLEI